MNKRKKVLIGSGIASFLVLMFFGATGTLQNFLKDFFYFLLGNTEKISQNAGAYILIAIAVQIAVDLAILSMANESISSPEYDTLSYAKIIWYSSQEEIIFRWALIWIIALNPLSTVWFYFILLGSNLVWTILHIPNFKEEKLATGVLGLTNIFIFGLLAWFLFIKFGILAAIAAHILVNVIYKKLNKMSRE